MFPVYISFSEGVEHSYWSSQTLVNTLSGPHGKIIWLQLLHNVLPQLQFIFTILTQQSHLDSMEFIGLHNILLIINIQY